MPPMLWDVCNTAVKLSLHSGVHRPNRDTRVGCKRGSKVRMKRWIAGAGLGALVAAGFVAPAVGASSGRAVAPRADAVPVRNIGTFTPAAADPRLAALLSRSGLEDGGFRFTPSDSKRSRGRAITVAVRARSTLSSRDVQRAVALAAPAPSVGLAPIAYNLGVAVGWKRFAVSGDVTRVDLAGLPGSREAIDVGVSFTGRKFTGTVAASADRPLPGAPKLLSDAPSYSIDLGGSYALNRRLAVTAGVRYKTQNERLDRVTDNRQDSQAVYIGTALRF